MSVAGFDVGNEVSCVAIARKRGIDVLLNKESVRETPAVVNFGEKMRFIGVDGAAKQGLQPQNTVNQLKRLLGRKFKEPSVQRDIIKLPFRVSEGPDGGCLITVQFQNETTAFTPEQVMAMVLVDLKKIAETEAGCPPVDCVLSVPVYYSERQRYAMINAAQIAGLNCLRLINENTATALAYGIFKTDLPEVEPVHVAFVDVGHTSTQVAIVSLRKGGLQVRCHTWDSDLGGRDLDELLYDHFVSEFKVKFKIDVNANKKASFKLRMAVAKLKKVLSANAEAPLNIECLMDDVDVRSAMTRDVLEELLAPLAQRFQTVLEQALAQSGLTADALSSVEAVGSSTRVPVMTRLIESVFGKQPSRTMNAKECVSRGAALQCAMLSPVFKVREFDVIDAAPYAIDFHWEKDGKPTSQRVFDKNSPFPSAKMLTFLRSAPFTITAVNADTGDKIADYNIGPFNIPAGHEQCKLKAKVRLNLHGLLNVESVQAIEEDEAEAAAADAKMEDAQAANGAPAPETAGAAPMETDVPKAEEAAKKRKVRKTDVPFTIANAAGYPQKLLDEHFEKEGQMQAGDRLMEETADRKNAVEAYVYKLRNGLHGALDQYAKADEKQALLSQLQSCEDWLYEEGEDCTKSVYMEKLDDLKALGAPIELRAAEDAARPEAIKALQSTAQGYLAWASSTEPRYAHITPEERAPIATEAQAALNWLSEKVAQQSRLGKSDPPELMSADCYKKAETLERLARPIVNKPVPKPATPPPAPTPEPAHAAPASEEGTAPMESEGGVDAASPAPTPEPMNP